MPKPKFDRRSLLTGAGAVIAATLGRGLGGSGGAFAAPVTDTTSPFDPGFVQRLAQRLSNGRFSRPYAFLPAPFDQLSYDQYREVRFRQDQAIWRGEKLDYELQLLPLGWLYELPVDIWVADGGIAKSIRPDGGLFSLGRLFGGLDAAAPNGYSGFRIHGPVNRADYYDEYVVFQGASYFRAVGRGQSYGISARGLAINTAQPQGEEFPIFRSFWIEKPAPRAVEIVVHALLDSPSTTGAYRFTIQAGSATIMDVEATLFPRREMTHVGLAPLTTMFLHGPAHHRIDGDFRPSVHDSNGLAIRNGNGECLWRPLSNPQMLQVSAFVDRNPMGFGLCQRARSFHDYEDLEARFELRPTLWIEPRGAWGPGAVELIEIPTGDEVHDNIVAYWKPSRNISPGKPFTFAYRMHWTGEMPMAWAGARAVQTRVDTRKEKDRILFVVDFAGPSVANGREPPIAAVGADPGIVTNVVVQPNPPIDGVRVTFELEPRGSETCELRLALKSNEQQISETWLYRWTRT